MLLYVSAQALRPATSTWAPVTFNVRRAVCAVVAFASGGSWNGAPAVIPFSCAAVVGGGTVDVVVVPAATVVVVVGLADLVELLHAAAPRVSTTKSAQSSRFIRPVRRPRFGLETA